MKETIKRVIQGHIREESPVYGCSKCKVGKVLIIEARLKLRRRAKAKLLVAAHEFLSASLTSYPLNNLPHNHSP